jgi:hypothetical protein
MISKNGVAAETPELHFFRKHAIFATSLVIMAIFVIAFTGTTSHKTSSEEGLLFSRSLLFKGGLDTPSATVQPSGIPSSSPSKSAHPSAGPCVSPSDERVIVIYS